MTDHERLVAELEEAITVRILLAVIPLCNQLRKKGRPADRLVLEVLRGLRGQIDAYVSGYEVRGKTQS